MTVTTLKLTVLGGWGPLLLLLMTRLQEGRSSNWLVMITLWRSVVLMVVLYCWNCCYWKKGECWTCWLWWWKKLTLIVGDGKIITDYWPCCWYCCWWWNWLVVFDDDVGVDALLTLLRYLLVRYCWWLEQVIVGKIMGLLLLLLTW